MSTRHRVKQAGPTSALQEERDERKASHRKVRRSVNQSLHLATMQEELDDLVLDLPRPTHGYTDEHEPTQPRSASDPKRRLRHWKQPFWKRRNLERRRRNQEEAALSNA
ncbi:MAG: hypothetical protein KDB26_07250 [Microthrixaceae bacterium]|nr:hypothetical protein [Microthrixaceae bacterium]